MVGRMIDPILPAAIAVQSEAGDFVNNAAKESARRTAKRLRLGSTLLADLAGSFPLLDTVEGRPRSAATTTRTARPPGAVALAACSTHQPSARARLGRRRSVMM